jgi:DNA polymerase III delta subunit
MKVCQEFGKSIGEDDAKAIVTMNGFDGELKGLGMDQLRIATAKVCQYVGRKKNITHEDILINSFPSEEFVIWTIFDAMDTKDITNCLNTLYKLSMDDGGNDGGVNKLLNLALWRYRLLFFLKEAMAKGISKSEAIKEAMELVKLHQSGTGMQMILKPEENDNGTPKAAYTEYWISKELNGQYGRPASIDRYNRKELARIIQAIQDGLIEVRNRSSEASQKILADTLMFTVCSSMDDSKLSKVRNSYG